jgi:hypothetical protein
MLHLVGNISRGIIRKDTLPPLLLKTALKYTIRRIQENQMGLKINWTIQLLV